jgi:hypothetical protein
MAPALVLFLRMGRRATHLRELGVAELIAQMQSVLEAGHRSSG